MLKQAEVVWLRITVRYNSIVVLFLTLLFFICNHDRFGRWIAAPPLYPLAFGTAGQQQLSDTAAFGWRGSIYPFFCSLLFSSSLSLFLSHEEKKTTASRVQQRQRGISHATAADGREFDRGTLEQWVCVGKESSKVQCPLLCTAAAAAVLVFPLVSVGYYIYYYSDIPKGKKKSESERVQPTEPAGTALVATAPVGLLIFNKELLLV